MYTVFVSLPLPVSPHPLNQPSRINDLCDIHAHSRVQLVLFLLHVLRIEHLGLEFHFWGKTDLEPLFRVIGHRGYEQRTMIHMCESATLKFN